LELELKNLLDEQTSSMLKSLILEENLDVFNAINAYKTRAITDKELSFKLARLAANFNSYIERPQSPLPKRKQELLNYINSLTRYHFNDPDDI